MTERLSDDELVRIINSLGAQLPAHRQDAIWVAMAVLGNTTLSNGWEPAEIADKFRQMCRDVAPPMRGRLHG